LRCSIHLREALEKLVSELLGISQVAKDGKISTVDLDGS
jgi:hypothetical protein